MRNRILFLLAFFFLAFTLNAQESGYKFKKIKKVPVTSVKDQHRSGTCWSFAGVSFMEAEILRKTGKAFDLSEMFAVRYTYEDKVINYVRYHGKVNLSAGGQGHDVMNVVRRYGIVPESAYPGIMYGEEKHVHMELDEILTSVGKAVVENKNKKLTPVWIDAYNAVLDAYLGETPEKFEYNGNEYTPKSFTDEVLQFNPDDYIEIGSFSHQPFYEPFIIEIPDNWSYGQIQNVPLDELTQIMDYALKKGYTICWDADVSHKGFSHTNGVAIVPEKRLEDMSDTERSRWEKLSSYERSKMLYTFDEPGTEKQITQEYRQECFDNYTTTDDHLMHICGTAKDQNGTKYYLVKNSWGESNLYDGYFYASESFIRLQTIMILIHKDAIPKKLAEKMGL